MSPYQLVPTFGRCLYSYVQRHVLQTIANVVVDKIAHQGDENELPLRSYCLGLQL